MGRKKKTPDRPLNREEILAAIVRNEARNEPSKTAQPPINPIAEMQYQLKRNSRARELWMFRRADRLTKLISKNEPEPPPKPKPPSRSGKAKFSQEEFDKAHATVGSDDTWAILDELNAIDIRAKKKTPRTCSRRTVQRQLKKLKAQAKAPKLQRKL